MGHLLLVTVFPKRVVCASSIGYSKIYTDTASMSNHTIFHIAKEALSIMPDEPNNELLVAFHRKLKEKDAIPRDARYIVECYVHTDDRAYVDSTVHRHDVDPVPHYSKNVSLETVNAAVVESITYALTCAQVEEQQ